MGLGISDIFEELYTLQVQSHGATSIFDGFLLIGALEFAPFRILDTCYLSIILLWHLCQIFPTLHLTPQGNFILRDMSYPVSQLAWWVIWGELQGYGDPIHGHGTRESWRETFSNPLPLFSPHPFIMVHSTKGGREGGKHGLYCDLRPPPLLQLHLSCICPLTTGIQPKPLISIFDSKYFFFVKTSSSLLVWIYSGERAIADSRWFGRVQKGHCREYGGQFLGNFASRVQEKFQPDPLLGNLQE